MARLCAARLLLIAPSPWRFQRPFGVDFRHGGDVAAYAGAYTGFLRAISEPVVKAGLRQAVGESEIVERLYERVRARLQAEPERYWFRYFIVAALLTCR